MNLEQLETKMNTLTPSEIRHRDHPGELSPHYKKMERTEIDGEKVYIFKFDSIMNEHNICLNRDSRFTGIPKHLHSVIEINYVYRGRMVQIIDGKQVVLNEHDVCLLDTNTVHEVLPLTEDDLIITIDMRKSYFTNSFLARLSSQKLVSSFLISAIFQNNRKHKYHIFRAHPDVEIHPVVQQLLCEYYDPRLCSNEIIDSYMIILFSSLLRMYTLQIDAGQSEENPEDNLALQVLRELEDHYQSATLNSVAEKFGFHPNYLSAYIRKHTGKTFKDLQIMQRMNKACLYLQNTEMPVSEIARSVGYENIGFFYRKFESLYGMSPTDYRKNSTTTVPANPL